MDGAVAADTCVIKTQLFDKIAYVPIKKKDLNNFNAYIDAGYYISNH